jgi:hypothetical protein
MLLLHLLSSIRLRVHLHVEVQMWLRSTKLGAGAGSFFLDLGENSNLISQRDKGPDITDAFKLVQLHYNKLPDNS